MAKKKVIPEYSKVKKNGTEYYRTRILDADGKQVDINTIKADVIVIDDIPCDEDLAVSSAPPESLKGSE